ncbi:MAG: carboxypeptidase-like regulatory domain-containing protein [Acidobacteriota bacterium]
MQTHGHDMHIQRLLRVALRRQWPIVLSVISLWSVGANGAQITISQQEATGQFQTASVRALRLDGVGDPMEQTTSVPGTTDLTLPEGLWEVQILGDRMWAPPVHLRNDDSSTVRVWPAVALTGTLNAGSALRARFTSLEPQGASGEARCAVAGEKWECWLPTGRYDLRFSAPGSAPEFRFDMVVPKDSKPPKDLKPPDLRLQFVAGASLSGSVEAARGSRIPVEGTKVVMIPASRETAGEAHVVSADGKGFFQFKGLAPGDYSVGVNTKGLVARTQSVNILADRAAELSTPLLLDTPKRLTVTVMPPLDPAGVSWSLRLVSFDARARTVSLISESQATAAGEWSHRGLTAGEYEVQIRLASGELWKSETVVVGFEDVAIAVFAPAMRITGLVTLGDRPLSARLSFGGEGGPMLNSDAEGRVTGEIPPDDQEERSILVEAETPRVRRTVKARIQRNEGRDAYFTINLTATTLMGRVVDEDRSPQPDAILTVTRDANDFEQGFTEKDGSFEIAGLEPGEYNVTAAGFRRLSKPISVELRKGEAAEVELVLERNEQVRGRMTMGDTPVISAEIYARSREAWTPIPHQVRTNERGFFELDLPPGTKTYDGLAVHPAFDIVIGRGSVRPGRIAWVRTNQIGGMVIIESTSYGDLVLGHNGAEVDVSLIVSLAGSVVPGRLTVPRLEPGQYSVCSRKSAACVNGYLAPRGTLTLTIDQSAD